MSVSSTQHCSPVEIADALQVGIVLLDRDGCILLWNDWIARHSGIVREQAIGKSLQQLFPDFGSGRLAQAIDHALTHNLPSLLSTALHKTPLPLFSSKTDHLFNRRIQQMVHILPISNDQGNPCCLIQVSDMTASVSREKVLRHQADQLRRANYIDRITGINNRKKFDEVLAMEFHRAQRAQLPIALIIADIDHFKHYNDLYGHTQGDQCLARVAQELQHALRRAGDLVARYGDEEFGILLPGTDETAAAIIAENLRMRISKLGIPHESSPVTPQVSISLGVAALTPEIGSDSHSLVSAADVALYEAKHSGRNRAILLSIEDGSYRTCA